jgi:hypothetical protein
MFRWLRFLNPRRHRRLERALRAYRRGIADLIEYGPPDQGRPCADFLSTNDVLKHISKRATKALQGTKG